MFIRISVLLFMFRNIILSRKVNKARRRLFSTIPSSRTIILGISLNEAANPGEDHVNDAFDLADEGTPNHCRLTTLDSIEPFGVAQNCLIFRNAYPSDARSLCFISPASALGLSAPGKSRCILMDLPLPLVARILVDTMDPASVFALDAILNSAENSNTLRSIAAHPPGQCVHFGKDTDVPCSFVAFLKRNFGATCFPSITSEFASISSLPNHVHGSQAGSNRESFNSVYVVLTCSLNLLSWFCSSHPLTLRLAYTESELAITQNSLFCIDPLFAACKAWRWADLRPGEWLRRLPICRSSKRAPPNRLCINPQHWSRVISSDDTSDAGDELAAGQYDNEPGLVRVCVWVNGDHLKPFPCCLIRASENIPANRDVPATGSISDLLSSSPTRPAVHARNTKNPAREQKSNTLSATGTVTPAPPYQNSPHGRSIFTDASYKLPSVDYTCNTELTNLSLDSRTDDLKLPDLETDSASHESSISSSSLDDFGTRNRPKKPRPVYDTFNFATTGIRTMLSLKRAWANLAYWESNHHVAKGWFSLDDPVTYILYAEGISKHSPKSSSGRPGDHFSCVRHCRDASYIRLFPLVTQPSPRPHIRTICSTKLPGVNDSNFTHTAQKRYSFFFPTDSRTPARSSTSWRQCYRLGGSGLVLSLTPHGRIWLDNQAIANNLTVFVSSPCLSRGSKSTNAMCWPVRRVPSGFSIVIFDLLAYQRRLPESFRTDTPSLAKASRSDTQANLISSLVHHPLVHISLGKGWGPGYRRPDITHCPARLELWINTDSLLGLIDK